MSTRLLVVIACSALISTVPIGRAGAQAGGAAAPAMTGAVGETQTGLAAVYG